MQVALLALLALGGFIVLTATCLGVLMSLAGHIRRVDEAAHAASPSRAPLRT